jgi:hypothetical protein
MKPWIEAIHAYVPGRAAGADGRPLVKLSANENPLGSSPLALVARTEAAAPSRYPDPDSVALREAIGALHSIDAARIVCGTGSGELLKLAVQAFAGPGDEVIHVRYGFSLYDIVTRGCGATPVVAPDADYAGDVDALLACVTERTRLVFLANPNNPTGSYLSAAEVVRLHAGLPHDVLLVLDQAYAEYLEPEDDDEGLALAAENANVLVTRTFSKIYGLAGERVGWATGHPGSDRRAQPHPRAVQRHRQWSGGGARRLARSAVRGVLAVDQRGRAGGVRSPHRCTRQPSPAGAAEPGQLRHGPVRGARSAPRPRTRASPSTAISSAGFLDRGSRTASGSPLARTPDGARLPTSSPASRERGGERTLRQRSALIGLGPARQLAGSCD